jgi:hypothetical protein
MSSPCWEKVPSPRPAREANADKVVSKPGQIAHFSSNDAGVSNLHLVTT